MCIHVTHLLIGSVNDIRIYLHLWGALNWHLTTQQPLSHHSRYRHVQILTSWSATWMKWTISDELSPNVRTVALGVLSIIRIHTAPFATRQCLTLLLWASADKLTVHLMDITTSRSDTTITMLLATHPWIEQSDTNGITEKHNQKAYHSFMLIFTKRGVF